MSHVVRINESCHTWHYRDECWQTTSFWLVPFEFEWRVTTHIWMSHGTHVYVCIPLPIARIAPLTPTLYMYESRHTWMSHVWESADLLVGKESCEVVELWSCGVVTSFTNPRCRTSFTFWSIKEVVKLWNFLYLLVGKGSWLIWIGKGRKFHNFLYRATGSNRIPSRLKMFNLNR